MDGKCRDREKARDESATSDKEKVSGEENSFGRLENDGNWWCEGARTHRTQGLLGMNACKESGWRLF